jgi:hypothetical protein
MKKQTLSFIISAPKARAHRVLFDRDLPFRARVEKTPKQYQRKPKHRNQLGE